MTYIKPRLVSQKLYGGHDSYLEIQTTVAGVSKRAIDHTKLGDEAFDHFDAGTGLLVGQGYFGGLEDERHHRVRRVVESLRELHDNVHCRLLDARVHVR